MGKPRIPCVPRVVAKCGVSLGRLRRFFKAAAAQEAAPSSSEAVLVGVIPETPAEEGSCAAPPPAAFAGGEVAIDPSRRNRCNDPNCEDEFCEQSDLVPGGGRTKFDVRVDRPLMTKAGVKPILFVHDKARTVEAVVEDDQQPAFSTLMQLVTSTGNYKAYFKARYDEDDRRVYVDTTRMVKRNF